MEIGKSAELSALDREQTHELRDGKHESLVVPRRVHMPEPGKVFPAPRALQSIEAEADEFELYCPFESGINTHADVVQAESVTWACRVGLIESAAHRDKIERSRIALLEALVFHDAPLAPLQLAADWTTLFCLLDDQVESYRLGPVELSAVLSRVLAAFRGVCKPTEDALGLAFDDLRTRMLALANPSWVMRFASHLEELFCGYLWEEINRRKGLRPSDGAYRVMRVDTIGLRPQFLLGELCDGFSLSDSARSTPELAELERITSRAVGWANDIFTCAKELAGGEVHNLVLVLMDVEQLSLARALQLAVATHDAEVRNFLSVRARLPEFPVDEREDVRRYVHVLECWIRGHLDWSRETGRYSRPPISRT